MKLFPGCTVSSRLPYIEAAVRYIAESLDIEISGTETMCCFEPTGLRSMDQDMWRSVGSIVHSKNSGENLVTLCEGCNISLTLAQEKLTTEEGMSDAERRLSSVGMVAGIAEINGLLEFLYNNIEDIKKLSKVSVKGTGVVFPGCHGEYAYKTRGNKASDMMAEILDSVGCSNTVINKPMCCGGGLQGVHDDIANNILQDAVGQFKEVGADFAVVSCVFCFRRLDISAKFPVMHISEIVADALGWNTNVSKYHRTDLQLISIEK